MYCLMVTMQIKPDRVEQFREAILDDAIGSVNDEPGCVRFDVHQDSEDENRFYLYEVYKDAEAFEAHKQAPHFKRFFEATDGIHSVPPEIKRCVNVYPSDEDWK